MHPFTPLGQLLKQHVPVWSWPRSGIRVGLCLPSAATHPPVSSLQVQEWLGNSCHFLSMPYSGKMNSQDAEPSRTLKLAEESMRVGVLQSRTEEGLSGPSQRKLRLWAAGRGLGGEKQTYSPGLPRALSRSHQSPPKQRWR